MTHLRQRMQEELLRRNYSAMTAECYVRNVAAFAKHFGKSPDVLGAEEIRQFQLHLIQDRKVAWPTYIQNRSALRFLYVKTLNMPFMTEHIPLPKLPKRLPIVLSKEEIARLLDCTRTLAQRALLMTLYGAGLRVSEACRLTVADIDTASMVIHVLQAKGRKDRDVMLSPVLLDTLRRYWKLTRSTHWLFPGAVADKPITAKAVFLFMRKAAAKAGIRKRSPRIPCATASPRTCSKPVPTCERFRCCSATPGSIPPCITCTFSAFEILLVLEAAVRGQQEIDTFFLSSFQQVSVRQPVPTLRIRGDDRMPNQRSSEALGRSVVKENEHRQSWTIEAWQAVLSGSRPQNRERP